MQGFLWFGEPICASHRFITWRDPGIYVRGPSPLPSSDLLQASSVSRALDNFKTKSECLSRGGVIAAACCIPGGPVVSLRGGSGMWSSIQSSVNLVRGEAGRWTTEHLRGCSEAMVGVAGCRAHARVGCAPGRCWETAHLLAGSPAASGRVPICLGELSARASRVLVLRPGGPAGLPCGLRLACCRGSPCGLPVCLDLQSPFSIRDHPVRWWLRLGRYSYSVSEVRSVSEIPSFWELEARPFGILDS